MLESNYKGTILEKLPNIQFKIELEDGSIVRAYLSGKMNRNFIKVEIGDLVEIFLPENSEIGRIVRRR